MSWTWCIGMFLPVLMVRDFGFWGWVVFAVPNVVGAAAMGFVLRDRDVSDRAVANHPTACAAFSAVTVLFQVMFVGGVVRQMIGATAGEVLLASAFLTVAAATVLRRGDVLVGLLVFAASVWAIAVCVRQAGWLPSGFPSPLAHEPADRVRNLLMLAPAVVFGFLLCPYLDLTFHRARQSTAPAQGAAAFAFGFGGPFLLMIAFTLWYAPLLADVNRVLGLSQPVRWAIGIHISAQCGYTVGLHCRELVARSWKPATDSADPKAPPKADGRVVAGILLGFVASGLPHLGAAAAARAHSTQDYTLPSPGEMTYRLFMAFYGLTFPAYVWLVMLPTRDGDAAPTRRKLRVCFAAVLVASPMFWKGFIDSEMIWLLPGVAVVLLARLLVSLGRPRSPAALPALPLAQ